MHIIRKFCYLSFLFVSIFHSSANAKDSIGFYYPDAFDTRMANYEKLVVNAEAFTLEQITELADQGTELIAYITIGESDELLTGNGLGPGGYASWYFDQDGDGQPDKNGNWESYFVNTADPEWKTHIFSKIDELAALGISGLFLDTVDTVDLYPESTDGMVDLIESMNEKVNSTEFVAINGKSLIIVQNRGFTVMDRTAPFIDALLFESFTGSYQWEPFEYLIDNSEWTTAMADTINELRINNTHLDVWTLDYRNENDVDSLAEFLRRAARNGFKVSTSDVYITRLDEINLNSASSPALSSVDFTVTPDLTNSSIEFTINPVIDLTAPNNNVQVYIHNPNGSLTYHSGDIIANYLIDGGALHEYVGDGTSWAWNDLGAELQITETVNDYTVEIINATQYGITEANYVESFSQVLDENWLNIEDVAAANITSQFKEVSLDWTKNIIQLFLHNSNINAVYDTDGVIGNFLIESGNLYEYVGDGTSWEWNVITTDLPLYESDVDYFIEILNPDYFGINPDNHIATYSKILDENWNVVEQVAVDSIVTKFRGSSLTLYSISDTLDDLIFTLDVDSNIDLNNHLVETFVNTHSGNAIYTSGGITADYLVSGGVLYQYTGTGIDWVWSVISETIVETKTVNSFSFNLPKSNINISSNHFIESIIYVHGDGTIDDDVSKAVRFVTQGRDNSFDKNLPGALDIISLTAEDVETSLQISLSTREVPTIDDHYTIYIDNKNSTGFAYFDINAAYMIQDDGLYQYTGTGTDWSWAWVQGLTNLAPTENTIQYQIETLLLSLNNGDSYFLLGVTADVGWNTADISSTYNSVINQRFQIVETDYLVYEASDGTLYLVSQTSNDVYKIVEGEGERNIYLSSLDEFNLAVTILLTSYSIEFFDYDADGELDLMLSPISGSELNYILVYNINAFEHQVHVESIDREIGDLSMEVQDVSDAVVLNNSRPVTTDVVGTLNSSAQISNGQVSYNVPIKLPPGRKGMHPNVSLSYSSGARSGIAGVGWQLTATSSITRCSASWVEDSKTGRVNLSDDDRLCLNGKKLILVDGQYGANNSEYRTVEESFQKVMLLGGSYSNQSSYFHVIDKSGRETYYGETSNSILVLNNTTPFQWSIERVIDNSVTENTILYDYSNSSGELLLTDIFYTGQGTVTGNRTVHFEYEDREDKSFQYISGGLLSSGQRLKEIVSSIDSVSVSKYYLSYETTTSAVTNRTRLESITQCGFESLAEKCLPSKIFDYSGQSQSFNKVESTNTLFNNDAPHSLANQLLGDYNNDGILDFVRNKNLHLMSIENNQLEFLKVIELPFISISPDLGEQFKLGQLDFDGDGQLDILGLTSSGLTVASLNSAQDGFIQTHLNIPMNCSVKVLSLQTYMGRINYGLDYKHASACRADAIPDKTGGFYLFHRSSSGSGMKLSRIHKSCTNNLCSTQSLPGIYDLDESYTIHDPDLADFRIMDFDGDGDPDLTRLVKNGDSVELVVITHNQNGSGANTASSFTKSTITLQQDMTWVLAAGGHHWIDANGDGLKDLLIFDTTWKLYLNQGGALAAVIDTGIIEIERADKLTNQLRPSYTTHGSIKIVDFNGDGLEDFMFLDRDVNSRNCLADRRRSFCKEGTGSESFSIHDFNISALAHGKYSVYLSSVTGNGNVEFQLKETEIEGTSSYFYPLDIDSDGVLDFIGAKWVHDYTISDTSQELQPTKVYFYFGQIDSQSIQPDYLLSAQDDTTVNSFGLKDEFEYQSYIRHRIDKVGTSQVDNSDLVGGEYYRIPSSQMVAIEHRVNNVLSGQNITNYEYSDPVFHQSGLGFLGFESIKEVDHAKGVTREAFYRMDYPLNGRKTSSTLRETSDNSVLKSETLM